MPADQEPTGRIGPYRLLEKLGEGGMGAVYLAEQEKPVRRRVAIKVIKLGMDTKEVIARFEAERQALAMMNHPNVAQVYDTGATDQGRPYFVMEHVGGVSITDYCDRHQLSTRERLELIVPVCQAVHHAHQRGIIHRDLKPSNVLVTLQDGSPMPKVIDFGVAKAIEHRLSDKTVHTEQGRLIGTPEYMSPEQAEMTGLNIDTTTDVYSLGVILYEVLTGTLPFERATLLDAGLTEMHRIIRESAPPLPSTRVGSLRKELRGELDWITMRAMEKDRTRRYQSASELAADIERYLANEPVLARRPSTTYQLRKLVVRHKVRFGLLVLLTLTLIGFAATMSIQADRIARERDRANQEAETAQQVSSFLVGLFEVPDPSESKGNTITAREILDKGAAEIREELSDQPLVQARLMSTMGTVYQELGLLEPAGRLLEEALETKQAVLGPEHQDVARDLQLLGRQRRVSGKFDEARDLCERALAIQERTLGPDAVEVSYSLNSLACVLTLTDRMDEAQPLFERSLAIREQALGPDDPDVASALNDLSTMLCMKGDFEEARPLLERSIEIQERTEGSDHPIVAVSLQNLGALLASIGDEEAARPVLARALAIQEKVLGPDHPEIARVLCNLGCLSRDQGDHQEARRLFERAHAIIRDGLGPDHPEIVFPLSEMGRLCREEGSYGEAQRLYQRAWEVAESAYGPGDSQAMAMLRHLARLAALQEDRDQAIAHLSLLLERGYQDDGQAVADHPDFAFLRGDPEFEAIVAEMGQGRGGGGR